MNNFDKEVSAAEILHVMYLLCDAFEGELSDQMRSLICELGYTGILSRRAFHLAKERVAARRAVIRGEGAAPVTMEDTNQSYYDDVAGSLLEGLDL